MSLRTILAAEGLCCRVSGFDRSKALVSLLKEDLEKLGRELQRQGDVRSWRVSQDEFKPFGAGSGEIRVNFQVADDVNEVVGQIDDLVNASKIKAETDIKDHGNETVYVISYKFRYTPG